MNIIYKYPLKVEAEQILELYVNSHILSIQVQNNIPVMWVSTEVGEKYTNKVIVRMHATGEKFSFRENEDYFETIQLNNGTLVLHITLE